MAKPTITFNSSGSDTQASGSGTPATAVFGTNGAYTLNVWTLDGTPDLSAVPTDGSGVLWVSTSTGRKFYDITGVDDTLKTVTTTDNGAGTATGRTWAIGGKRATLNDAGSRSLCADIKGQWSVNIETDQTITSALSWTSTNPNSTNGAIIIYGASGRTVITDSANDSCFSFNGLPQAIIRRLKFACSNGTKTIAYGINTGSNCVLQIEDCILGDATNKLTYGIRSTQSDRISVADSLFVSSVGEGVIATGVATIQIVGCSFRGNCSSGGTASISMSSASSNSLVVIDSDITTGLKPGISVPGIAMLLIKNLTIHGNTGASTDGIIISGTTAICAQIIVNNNITANGRYGFSAFTLFDATKGLIDYNNYGNAGDSTTNSSGAYNALTAGAHDLGVACSYGDAANFNFSVGTNLKAVGWPDAARKIGGNPSLGTVSYVDIGEAQRQEAASGGGMLVHPGLSGGMRG